MIDVQSFEDDREIPLTKVGVKQLRYPVRVLDKANGTQHTSARVDLFASLPQHFKGTHMSRFIEIFHRYKDDLSMPRFLDMLGAIRDALAASAAFGRMRFPYFIEKRAPVSGLAGMLSYECCYAGRVGEGGTRFTVSIAAPVSTVCPCSKALSERGAHNQRGIVRVELELGPFFWIEDIIDLIEKAASSPVYAVLKREDEKWVTEHGYDNPKFVEDVVRDVYAALRSLGRFPRFTVEAENFESIHDHNAYARAEYAGNASAA
ncbi:MAG: GTP cyclohydrolase FolE2 [Treponema sp.]|jgi:GTP cyclohydrolase I|nr:GTP cyclohydrolase FolE2 [Treponema sp.]